MDPVAIRPTAQAVDDQRESTAVSDQVEADMVQHALDSQDVPARGRPVKVVIGILAVAVLGAAGFVAYQQITKPELIRTIEVPIDGQTDVMQWVSHAFGVAAEECRQHPEAEQVRFTFDEAGQASGMARQYYANIEEMPGAVNCVGVPGSKQAEAANTGG